MAQNECVECGEFHNKCACPKCGSKLMAHDEQFDNDNDFEIVEEIDVE